MVKLDPSIHAQYANLAKAFRGTPKRNTLSRSLSSYSGARGAVKVVTQMNDVVIKDAFQQERKFNHALKEVLHKFGAYVRKTAKQSMRYRRVKRLDTRFVRRVTISQAARFTGGEVQQELFTPRGKVDLPFYRYPSSKPGEPPFAHTNPLLRRLINYSVDFSDLSVVIGPLPAAQKIAELMEYGGNVERMVAFKPNEFGQLIVGGMKGQMKKKMVTYRHRPYMRPAFWKSMDFLKNTLLPRADLAKGLKNSIVQKQQKTIDMHQRNMFNESMEWGYYTW